MQFWGITLSYFSSKPTFVFSLFQWIVFATHIRNCLASAGQIACSTGGLAGSSAIHERARSAGFFSPRSSRSFLPGRKKAGRWNAQSTLGPMCDADGTSAPSALPVRLTAAKNFLSKNRKSNFLSLFLSHQWCIFKSLFDALDPNVNTFMPVVMMLISSFVVG